jgi:hypothetical protein
MLVWVIIMMKIFLVWWELCSWSSLKSESADKLLGDCKSRQLLSCWY